MNHANADTDDVNEESDFKQEDFLLVMQTRDQAQMMVENPRIVCADATHGLTNYDYLLLTIMVIDKFGHGLAAGWAITSRENSTTWRLFARSLYPEARNIQPEVIMTDDANSAYNGLKHVWNSLNHKLLCHWHLKRAVRKHCMACEVPPDYKKKNSNKDKKKATRVQKVGKKPNKRKTASSGKQSKVGKKCNKWKTTKKRTTRAKSATQNGNQWKTSSEGKVTEPTRDGEENTKGIHITARTFGIPAWEFFYILVEETDEATFYTYLRAFRDNLKRYKLFKLLSYFEDHYFKPDRIKQWATWYRLHIYDCKWLLNTNMHVEAFHNILKTHIMERKHNTRVDKLMKILRKTECMYFWKWSRTRLGLREMADDTWLHMRGEEIKPQCSTLQCETVVNPLPDDGTEDDPLRTCKNLRVKIQSALESVRSLLPMRELEPSRLRSILKQVNSVKNVLLNAQERPFAPADRPTPIPGVDEGSPTPIPGVDEGPQFTSLKKKRKKKIPPLYCSTRHM